MKLPLYYQVYCKLLARIDSGEYKPGDMLPTEQELMEFFSTSRAPIRQALGLLENEGAIQRFPGKGTFVSAPPEELVMWFTFSPFHQSFKRDWEHIRCQTILAEMAYPPEEVRNFLFFEKKEKAMYLERIRYRKNVPVIFSQHYFHPSIDFRNRQGVNDFSSIRAMLMKHFSIEITRMDDTLRALAASEKVASHLPVAPLSPVLLTERRSFSYEQPVQFDCFYTVTDVWNYRVVFAKEANGTTAASTSD